MINAGSVMKINPDQQALLDRGGKPTMRDLVDRLEFRPATGSITLAGERLVLKRASMHTDLQQQLIRQFGQDDAMAILLRNGFNAGREDAEFIRKTWPNIDIGDAFTAGTRLHMVTGTVRVDTLANDFDFDADRFRAEFEWHDSVEASEYNRRFGQAHHPVCWSQLGYASGYASEFFRKLVIYKEVQCAAMGHKHCRLQGRTSDTWGDDPFAKFFLEKVLLRRKMEPLRRRPDPSVRRQGSDVSTTDMRLMTPIQNNLDRLVSVGLGGMITGPEGAGQERVARWMGDALCSGTHKPIVLASTATNAASVIATWATGQRHGALVLLDVDKLAPPLQAQLAAGLSGDGQRAPIVATASGPLVDVAGERVPHRLFHQLSTLGLDLPPLWQRQDELADLASACLADMQFSDATSFAPAAIDSLKRHHWPGEFAEFVAVIRRCALLTAQTTIPSGIVETALSQQTEKPSESGSLWPILRKEFERDGLSLPSLLAQIQTGALADCGGNVAAAARVLGITRAQLAYQIKSNAESA